MNSADVFEQIEKMGQLPSLPQTLLHVQQVATDRKSSADDLAGCILKDQALTMRVLKVVNSARYLGRSREKINTVHRAVVVMGFETVRKLALGLSVFDMMSKLSRSPWLVRITRHSLTTAAFAQVLAEAAGSVAPEEAFVAALVHDIGKVVLVECSPDAMDNVLRDRAAGADTLDAERRHFGLAHDRAGRRLADRWRLPREIQEVIGGHHDIDPLRPPKRLDPLLGVIVYANAMSRFRCVPETQETEYRILRRAGRSLGIPAGRLGELYAAVESEIHDLAECLGLEPDSLSDYAALVNAKGGVNVAPRRISPEEVARRTVEQLELYQFVGRGLAAGDEPEPLLERILQGAVQILGFERVVLLAVNRRSHSLAARSWAGVEAGELAPHLDLPLKRSTGALALAVLEHRAFHVPQATSEAYDGLVGEKVLAAAHCTGFAVVPVTNADGLVAVIYADGGPDGDDVTAEQTAELGGLALQAGLVLGIGCRQPTV